MHLLCINCPMTRPYFEMTLNSPREIVAESPAHDGRVVRIGSARSWTGRSAVSRETDTILSRISTSGIHRTRVSAVRDAGPQASTHDHSCTDASGFRAFSHAGDSRTEH
jgi:hypothetical protein